MSNESQDPGFGSAPPPAGGLGGEYEILKNPDLNIIKQAIAQKWDIPQTILKALPSQLAKIFIEETSTRNKLAAAKVLVSMTSENRATAHLALQATQGQSPLITVNNLSVNEIKQEPNKASQVHEIVAELRKLGVSLVESEEPLQPAQAEPEAENISHDGDAGPLS